MILFITPSQRGSECATAIETAIGRPAQAVKSFQEAAALLRTHNYSAVVIDECLMDADPAQGNLVLQHIETATPIYVNCAISGTQRIIENVQTALQRRARDEAAARRSALASLRCELREPLTGIILNCELVLGTPNLPADLKEKIRAVNGLAQQLGAKLQLDEALTTNSR
jgi:signal transduction histidine kinase